MFKYQTVDRPTCVDPCFAGEEAEDKVDVALPTHVDVVPSSSRERSWGISPTIVGLHGGFSTPVFCHAELSLPRTLPQHVQHPTLPSPNHAESLRQCIHKGWHTCHFNAWALESQLNAGVAFLPLDERINIGNTLRLNTFTLSVSLKPSGPWNCRSQLLYDQIVNRVSAGARFT